ncbi:MAG TPA: hypothetical protein VFU21_02995 [Kofleriaceae bacterium]|nr:hypothetical protein [Kofleriaceae bacterium]
MRGTILLVAALGAAAPGLARADEDAPAAGTAPPPPAAQAEKEEDGDRKQGVGVDAELTVVYTSNVFREQARRLDDFDSKNDPGERFEDMEGPGDVYARPALGIDWTNKVGSGRRLKLSAGADFTAYARNGIANYATLEAGGSFDVTKHDRLGLEVEFIPRRFKENYFNDVGGTKVFDRAYYLQVAPELSYRREWTKRWATELLYELSLRRFEDPFPHRDVTTHSFALLLARELSGRVTVKLGPEVAFARVDEHMEFGATVDRSHTDLGALGALELNLRHGWAAEAEVEYKRKSYGSDDPADDAHHERRDDGLYLDAEVRKRMTHTWYLTGMTGLTVVKSNRDDPTIDADDYGYTELVVGVGGLAKF